MRDPQVSRLLRNPISQRMMQSLQMEPATQIHFPRYQKARDTCDPRFPVGIVACKKHEQCSNQCYP